MLRSLAILALLSVVPVLRAGSAGEADGSLESAAMREITRREEDLVVAEQELKAGDAALKNGNIESAYRSYKAAVDLVPQGSAAGALRGRAVSRFSSASVRYAEYLVSRGQYDDARRVAQEVLGPRYNPDYRPAIVFLSKLEQANYFNKTITPELAAQRDEVSKLLNEAVGFYDSGRYDLAQKRYRQVLEIDKENAAAFRGLEEIEIAKQRYYESAYNDTRSRMLWQVDKAWERPHKLDNRQNVVIETEADSEREGTEKTIALLNSLIVPEIKFRDATLADAAAALRQESRSLGGADGKGINIVLNLPAQNRSAPDGSSPDETGTTTSPAYNDRITLQLTNTPLYEVLRYVARLAGLNIKIEPYAVTIGTEAESMQRKVFNVPAGFFSEEGDAATSEPIAQAGRPQPPASGIGRQTGVNAIDFFETRGVGFEQGSSASYSVATGKLQVVNTPSNLDLIESLIEAFAEDEPKQIQIQTKFVEISQNNLKELGFDWTLGPFSIGGSGVYGGGGDAIGAGRGYPFVNPATGVPVGTETLTGGLRTGSGTAPYSALSVNSINALLARSLGVGATSAPGPGIFSLAGVFTNPQFQVLIRALNQKKGIDLMAAPSVTTTAGKQAVVTISRIFWYPTEFLPPEIPGNTGGGQVNVGGVVTEQDPVVTPSFPTAFVSRDLGVTLTVEPNIGADNRTIDLTLAPEVVDFDGFINYGSPIFAPQRNVVGAVANLVNPLNVLTPNVATPNQFFTPTLLTENVINQPIFSKRKVETSVTVFDGQTVVLGGLIREDVQKVNDKVPLLGDIPLAGALFRSEVEQKIKKNLIVFCTPRILDAAGQYLRPDEDLNDEEQVVEPLGLPPEVTPPVRPSAKGGLTRK